jgi:hypothetical protein
MGAGQGATVRLSERSGSLLYQISDTANSILALCCHPEPTPSQYNGGPAFYTDSVDDLQAVGSAKTWLKHSWQP